MILRAIMILVVAGFLSFPPYSFSAGSSVPTAANAWDDAKYCGPPKRDASGAIARSTTAIRYFRQQNPCPATGLTTGACPGWQIDHVIPLACGGCDSVTNLSWLPSVLKSGKGMLPKDRWERKIYCRPMQLVPMPEKPLPLS